MDIILTQNQDQSPQEDGSAAMVEVPRMGAVNDNLHRVTEQTRALARPANTSKAYDGKRTELEEYLDHVWKHDKLCRLLDEYKVYRFIFYQCAREKRLSRRGKRDTSGPKFDKRDYEDVMRMYDIHSSIQSLLV